MTVVNSCNRLSVTIGVVSGESLRELVGEVEKKVITNSLQRNDWCKSRAAAELGLSRPGLDSKLKRYGINN